LGGVNSLSISDMVTTRHAANVQLEAEFMLLYISLKVLEFPDFFRLTSFPEKKW